MKQAVKYNTYSTYRTAVTQYIVPEIGKVRLATLKPPNVAAWLDDLDIGARSKQLAFATLRRAYTYAVELGIRDRSPLLGMKGPRVPKTEPQILNLKQVRKFLRTTQGSEWYPLIYRSLVTSMRQGELFGLAWEAVNLQEGCIRVTKALARTENGYALLEPKTATSRRRVDLPKDAVALLRVRHRKQCPNPRDLVFTSTHG
jgi:integrase